MGTIDSFGEGYATRSDEEGFGGIYGRNSKEDEETIVHGNAPEYDESQGCEVKEKERARNQNKASEEAGVKGKASGQSRFSGGSFFMSICFSFQTVFFYCSEVVTSTVVTVRLQLPLQRSEFDIFFGQTILPVFIKNSDCRDMDTNDQPKPIHSFR